jgi:hypothetical protein
MSNGADKPGAGDETRDPAIAAKSLVRSGGSGI